MNEELHTINPDDKATVLVASPPIKAKPPYRAIAALILMAITALGLMVLPRPTIYYPHVAVEASGLRIEFLLNGQQGKSACLATATSVAATFATSCQGCRTLDLTCIENPPQELRRLFDETPLPMPSARMANGIVTYSSAQNTNTPDLALMACRESEHQAQLVGDQAKVACYPAGAPRSHTTFEKQRNKTGHTSFTLLLGFIGAIIGGLTIATLITYYRHHQAMLATSLKQSSSGTAQIPIIPTHPWLQKLTLAGSDTLVLLSTFLALAWPESGEISSWSHLDRTTVFGHVGITLITIGWFWLLLEHYARRRPFWDELQEIIRVLATMFMISGAAAFVAGLKTGSSSHLIVWALNFLLIPIGRAGVRMLLDDLGLWQRAAVIIGTGENARDAYKAIMSERGMGYRILGFIQPPNSPIAGSNSSSSHDNSIQSLRTGGEVVHIGNATFPILDGTQSLESLLSNLGNPQIILALDSLLDPGNQTIIQRLLASHTNIHVIPSIRGLPLFGTQLSHFFSHEVLFLTVRNNLSRRSLQLIKRSFDLVAASVAILILSPLLLTLSYLIRQSGGPALYGHTRIGRRGKPFKCLKFRSMRPDADKVLKDLLASDAVARAEWEKDFKLKNDPRITRIGQFLRKTSLDELPQLFNIIKGDMSLVGPRPIVEAELQRYGESASLYLEVLPGLTGLWQVSGRNDTGYAERVALDAWYVQNWSLWYDIAILFKTINVVFNKHGAY